jgi:hypothetical protein
MKGRGLVVFLALILATLATAGVFMYSRGVEERPRPVERWCRSSSARLTSRPGPTWTR